MTARYDNSDGQVDLVPNKPIVMLKSSLKVDEGGFYRLL